MAKGQKRSSREVKKPKAKKAPAPAAAPNTTKGILANPVTAKK
jgi:hypothetical protein